MTNDSAKHDRSHVADLVQQAKVAMLTTVTADGKHVSRPMGLQEASFDGDLWFLTYENSAKAAQIRATPEVNVSFSDEKHHSWTSISGRAQIVDDRRKAEQLWSPALKAWFPDGLETPGATLIKIVPDTAEYWDAPTSTVGFAAGVLRAAVTRNPENDPVRNETVEL